MQKKLVSIIVPIYNVEKYLKRCVDSILSQTYQEIEVILVDDGSPDGCPAICDAYAKQDGRVRVIHQPNGGLSAARNAGLDVARGEWISFVDSDDYISLEMIDSLINIAAERKSDVVICRYCDLGQYKDSKNDDIIPAYTIEDFLPKDAVKETLYPQGTHIFNPAVWNKLYKRDVIGKLRFPKGFYFEDICFSVETLSRAKKISVLNKNLYFYDTCRGGSITDKTNQIYTEKGKKGIYDTIILQEKRLKFLWYRWRDDFFWTEYRLFLLRLMKDYCIYKNRDDVITNKIRKKFLRVYNQPYIKTYGILFQMRTGLFLRMPKVYYRVMKKKYKIE